MSQFWVGVSAGSLPPSAAQEFDTQNGNAVPLANILIINGFDSTENNANGIISKGGVVGTGTSNEVDIVITNRYQQSTTTIGAASSVVTILTALAAGTYTLDMSIAGYATSGGPAGNGYTIVGGVRSNGVTATLLPLQQIDSFEENINANAVMGVSGNTIIVTLTGAAGITFSWNLTGTYTVSS